MSEPTKVMTAAANGATYDQFIEAGWTDEGLVAHGMMEPRATSTSPTDERLIGLLDRVDRLEEEKKGIADDIRDVWAEAKAVGYDVKMAREIRKLRNMKPDERAEMETMRDTYMAATGIAP